MVDLVTNDYLSLRRDPRVAAAAARAVHAEGAGAGGSRLLGGDHSSHRRLEESLAAWQLEEGAVAFGSGTAANHGILGALLGPRDLAVSFVGNHASIVDGIRLSGCRKAVVPDGAAGAVEAALRDDPGGGERYVVVEGIHGMEGDRAPLADLADVCRRRGALLVVDEAHALGLLGPGGAGSVADAGVAGVVAARVNPCGKALGAAGGVVTCSRDVADLVWHRARALLFATALGPPAAAAAAEAAAIAQAEPWRRERALGLAAAVRDRLRQLGQDARGDGGAIVPWVLGSNAEASRVAAELGRAGFAVHAVRPPTVPEGTARVRLSLHADLSDESLASLLHACEEVASGVAR
jgi:7-keto-8-aminopelargonate synthetase-like enzyme